MSCKSLLYMVGMFVFVPVWIGLLWTDFLKIRERASQLLHAWVLGFATMLAAAQLVLVPFVMMQKTLTQALLLWRIILQILAVLSFVIWLGRRAGTAETVADAAAGTADGAGVQKKCGKAGTWTIVFGILAAVLILLQAYIPARYEHSDDDDSRFVAEEVSAVVYMTPCTGRIRSRRTTCTGIPGGTQRSDLAVGDVCRNACQRGKYGAGGVVACVSAVFP